MRTNLVHLYDIVYDIAVWCIHFVLFFFLLLQVTEVENDVMSPVQEEEGPNAVSQLAKKVCQH